jgi:hypothetical protein
MATDQAESQIRLGSLESSILEDLASSRVPSAPQTRTLKPGSPASQEKQPQHATSQKSSNHSQQEKKKEKKKDRGYGCSGYLHEKRLMFPFFRQGSATAVQCSAGLRGSQGASPSPGTLRSGTAQACRAAVSPSRNRSGIRGGKHVDSWEARGGRVPRGARGGRGRASGLRLSLLGDDVFLSTTLSCSLAGPGVWFL